MFFAAWVIIFLTGFTILGCTFDDGGNFDFKNKKVPMGKSLYDSVHNDYALMSQPTVSFFGVLRTSVGDLQPPQYDYWTSRYALGDQNWAKVYVGVIWAVWTF